MSLSHSICDHDGCSCRVAPDGGVRRGDSRYCCEGCADGGGCRCEGCTCGAAADAAAPTINRPQG